MKIADRMAGRRGRLHGWKSGAVKTLRAAIGGAALAALLAASGGASAELIFTVAGGGSGDGLPARSVSLRNPQDIAVAANGDVYIAETGNHRIRKVAAATGAISTVAGTGFPESSGDGGPAASASVHRPTGIAVGGNGDIYFTEAGLNKVRKITAATSAISTVKDNSSGTFMGLERIAAGPGGVVYVTDFGRQVLVSNVQARCSAIYRIDEATGVTERVVQGTSIYVSWYPSASGWGACSRAPVGIAPVASGDLLIADSATEKVTRLAASGGETVVAGGGTSNASGIAATTARLWSITGLAARGGSVIVTTQFLVREIDSGGIIRTIAGLGSLYGDDGDDKPAADSSLRPTAVGADGTGNIFLIDSIQELGTRVAHRRVRKIEASGPTMRTIAGNGHVSFFGDGGPAASAALATQWIAGSRLSASGLAVDSGGAIYVADHDNRRVRRIGPSGVIATVAGNGLRGTSGPFVEGVPATQARVTPSGVAVDAQGNLYIEDRGAASVRKVLSSTGTITTLAGGGSPYPCTKGTTGAATGFTVYPEGLAIEATGSLLILHQSPSDLGSYGCVLRVDTASGIATNIAGIAAGGFSGDGGPAVDARFNAPQGVAADALGNIYVSDTGNHRVRKIAAGTGTIQTIAGTGVAGFSGDGGPGTAASISSPKGIAADSAGNVYFNDTDNRRVRRIAAGTGIITTVAGDGTSLGRPADGIDATRVSLLDIGAGIAVDAGGTVFFVSSGFDAGYPEGNRIRKLLPRTPQTISFAPLSSRTLGDPSFEVSASATSALPVRFSSSTPATCTVYQRTVTLVGAGTCTIAANQAGNAAIAAAPEVTQSFAIGKASQVITFGALSGRVPGAPPFAVSASASSGLAVAFSSTTAGVCTVSGNTVTIVATGTCTLAANQAGNANYLAAPQVTQSFAVTKAAQVITIAPLAARPFGSSPFAVTATASSGLAVVLSSLSPSVCTVSGSTATIVAAGTCTIAGNQSGNSSYLPATQATTALTISKAQQTITFPAIADHTVTDAPFAISATASSGLAVSFSSATPATCGVSGTTVTLMGVGACEVRAAQAGNANYFPAVEASRAFTVLGTGGNTNIISTVGGNGVAGFAGDGGPSTSASLNIPRGLVVNSYFNDGWRILDAGSGRVRKVLSTGVVTTEVGNGTAGYAGDGGSATGAGFGKLFAMAETGYYDTMLERDVAYLALSDAGDHRIRLVDLTTGNISTWVGTGTAGFTADGPITGATKISAPGALAFGPGQTPSATPWLYFVDAGNHRVRAIDSAGSIVTVAGSGTAGYSGDEAAATAANLNGPAGLAVDASGNVFIADRLNHRIRRVEKSTGYISTVAGTGVAGFLGDGSAALAARLDNPTNVAISPSGEIFVSDAGNTRVRKFTVGGNITTVAGNGSTGFSGDGGLATLAALSASSPAGVDNSGIAGIAIDSSGDLWIADSGNQRVRKVVFKLRQAIVVPAQADRTFGDAPFTVSVTSTSGLPVSLSNVAADTWFDGSPSGSAVCTVSGSTVTLVGGGMCRIAAAQGGDATYHPASAYVHIRVLPRVQTIDIAAIADRTMVSGGFTASVTTNSGLVATLESTTPAVCAIDPPGSHGVLPIALGTCTLRATQAGNASYGPAEASRSFVVGLASQAISFPPVAPVVFDAGGPIPIVATVASSLPIAFASSTPGVCTVSATTLVNVGPGAFESRATVTMLSPGSCTLTASQGGNAQYAAAPDVAQVIAINRVAQSITFDAPPGRVFNGSPFGVGAVASSGLAVTLSSSTPGVCTASGGLVTLVAAGTCTIAADQSGDTYYAPAAPVVQSFVVTQAEQAIDFGPLEARTLGSPPFTVSATSTSGLPVLFVSATTAVCTAEGTTVTLVAAGTCIIVAVQSGDARYAPAPDVAQGFEVAAANALTVTLAGTGSGSVASSAAGIACPGDCGEVYPADTPVTLTATASPGSLFLGWGGACAGRAACQVTMSAARSVTATFALGEAGDADNDGIPDGVEIAEARDPLVKDNDVFGNARLFAMQMYRDFLNREGDPAGIQGWSDLVSSGSYTRLQVINAFLSSEEFGGFVSPVVRLYFATYLRVPDYAGLVFNAGLVRNGTVTLTQLADFFTASPEFVALYGSLDNAAFVTLLYNNVLGRAPDAAGLSGWVALLNGGYTRGQVLLGFSDSVEYQAAMANEVFVTMMYAGMLRRTPEPTGFSGWVSFLDAGTYTREQVINGFFLSTEYRGRFLP